MDNSLLLQLVTSALVGLGAGYVGSFMVLRRMSLVGDALSHVALPGIAVSLLWGVNPFFGAFAALFLAVILIWLLERKTEIPPETLVGIMFTLSLALGLLLTPEPELLEALFGDITQIQIIDFIITLVSVIAIFFIIKNVSNKLMLGIVSKEMAQANKIPINKINFIFLFLVAVVVTLGLKVVGTLLMGSLVIIPAAAAKNTSSSLSQFTNLAMIFGVVSAVVGLLAANQLDFAPGPTIVITAGIVFLATLFFKKNS